MVPVYGKQLAAVRIDTLVVDVLEAGRRDLQVGVAEEWVFVPC